MGTLAEFGQFVVIGGVVRDLHFENARRFRSDVDFVCAPESIVEFERFIVGLRAKKNRFGGYGILLEHGKIDIWPLERTWAATEGHISVRGLDDLLRCTFFDWDAVIYDPCQNRLNRIDGYFQRTAKRVLDVNLAENPNPAGNAVRALRYARRWNASFTPALALHVMRQINDEGWQKLMLIDRQSFATPLLPGIDAEGVEIELNACIEKGLNAKPFASRQLSWTL